MPAKSCWWFLEAAFKTNAVLERLPPRFYIKHQCGNVCQWNDKSLITGIYLWSPYSRTIGRKRKRSNCNSQMTHHCHKYTRLQALQCPRGVRRLQLAGVWVDFDWSLDIVAQDWWGAKRCYLVHERESTLSGWSLAHSDSLASPESMTQIKAVKQFKPQTWPSATGKQYIACTIPL